MDEAAILELLAVTGPLTASEIADALNHDPTHANARLADLATRGALESTTADGTTLWWLPEPAGINHPD